MDAVLFIVGIFFLWKGSMKFSRKTEPWPKSKKTGRIIGAVLLIPLVAELIFFQSIAGVQMTDHIVTLPSGSAYSNQQYSFNIIPPSGWMVDKSPTNGAVVEFVDRLKAVQAIMAVTTINQPQVTTSFFDTYVANGVQQAKNTPGITFIGSNKIVSGSMSYYLIEYKQKIPGGSGLSHVLQLSMLGKSGTIFVISGESDDAVWTNFESVIKASLQSFSLN